MNHEKYDTSKVKTITLNGKKYIDMSVIEDIKTELPDHSFWQDAGGEPLVAIRDVVEIIDRKVNEVQTELNNG